MGKEVYVIDIPDAAIDIACITPSDSVWQAAGMTNIFSQLSEGAARWL